MMLEELTTRAKTARGATEDDLWAVTPAYILLDFDKDDFCKLIDAIGFEKWKEKAARWRRLEEAEEMHTCWMNYKRDKARLEELEAEREGLQQRVTHYEGKL